jgi:hypothetical protein
MSKGMAIDANSPAAADLFVDCANSVEKPKPSRDLWVLTALAHIPVGILE